MRDLIYKILTEEFDNFDWVPNPVKVVVTNRGVWYPTNMDAMIALGVTGAKEFREKYGNFWRESEDYQKWRNESTTAKNWSDEDFLIYAGINLMIPKNGNICYLIDKSYIQGSDEIYKLIHIETGKEFIMGKYGFEKIED